MGSVSRLVELDTVSPTARAAFLMSFVAQALSRRDEPRHSLHASAKYRECSEDLIFFFQFENNLDYYCNCSSATDLSHVSLVLIFTSYLIAVMNFLIQCLTCLPE